MRARIREKDARFELTVKLSAIEDWDARIDHVEQLATEQGIFPAKVRNGAGGWSLRLLDRTATCTGSARGAFANWTQSTLREFGHV